MGSQVLRVLVVDPHDAIYRLLRDLCQLIYRVTVELDYQSSWQEAVGQTQSYDVFLISQATVQDLIHTTYQAMAEAGQYHRVSQTQLTAEGQCLALKSLVFLWQPTALILLAETSELTEIALEAGLVDVLNVQDLTSPLLERALRLAVALATPTPSPSLPPGTPAQQQCWQKQLPTVFLKLSIFMFCENIVIFM